MNDQLKETARWGEEMHLLKDIPAVYFKKGMNAAKMGEIFDIGGVTDLNSFVTHDELEEMTE